VARGDPRTLSSICRPDGASLGSCTREAHHAVGHRPQAGGRNRLSADVACPEGALIELAQRPFDTCERDLQGLPDADLGQAVDGLGSAIADPLTETLGATELRALCQRGDTQPRVFSMLFEATAHIIDIERSVRGRHIPVLPAYGCPTRRHLRTPSEKCGDAWAERHRLGRNE
jgi:hypothetical protein